MIATTPRTMNVGYTKNNGKTEFSSDEETQSSSDEETCCQLAPDPGDHPLLQQDMLHPDESFAEMLCKMCSIRRGVVFVLAVILSIVLLLNVHPHEFAVKLPAVNNAINEEDCRDRCRKNTQNICEGRHLIFDEKWCGRNGTCQSEEPIVGERAAIPPALGASPPLQAAILPAVGASAPLQEEMMKITSCQFKQAPRQWTLCVVIVCLVFGISLIIEGFDAAVVMVGTSCFFAFVGIINGKQAFRGFSNGGLMGLAALYPIAMAIQETGMVEGSVGVVLGNPSTFIVALFRMMIPVAIGSAFLSNTAIVQMMIPVIVAWARRLDTSPGKMLMPLSFAAQLGGTTTLIGSSICLVAKQSVDPALYNMEFFDLGIVGAPLALMTMVYIYIFLPCLTSSAAPSEPSEPDGKNTELDGHPSDAVTDEEAMRKVNDFNVTMLVVRDYAYVGKNGQEVCDQLKRLPGVHEANTRTETLKTGSKLHIRATADGIVALRHVRDLSLSTQLALHKLGGGRVFRNLYECVVQPQSSLVGRQLHEGALFTRLQCAAVGIRGKQITSVVTAGDVLLLEADERNVTGKKWTTEFSLTGEVADSRPPRTGMRTDAPRTVAVLLGMLTLVILVTLDESKLSYGGAVYVIFLLIINALTVQDIYQSMNASLLATIAGAFGISSALQDTGVAGYIGSSVVSLTKAGGTHAIRAAVYFVAMFLSLFMNNSATVAIMGPMSVDIAKQAGAVTTPEIQQAVKCLIMVIVYGAGTCLMTPLGYQTNLMVMPDGGYSFSDFTKYGFPVQLLHMISTLVLVWLMFDVLGL